MSHEVQVDFHLDNSKVPNYQIINFHEILWRHSQCEILFHISRPALVKHKQVACLLCLYCSITLLVPNTRWWCRKWPMMYYHLHLGFMLAIYFLSLGLRHLEKTDWKNYEVWSRVWSEMLWGKCHHKVSGQVLGWDKIQLLCNLFIIIGQQLSVTTMFVCCDLWQ